MKKLCLWVGITVIGYFRLLYNYLNTINTRYTNHYTILSWKYHVYLYDHFVGDKESQHRDLESVFAAVAVLSVLGFGMTVAMLIRKRGNLEVTYIAFWKKKFYHKRLIKI